MEGLNGHQHNQTGEQKREVELVVISDVHLGTHGSQAKEVNNYLRSINPRTLILNGDIIDIWQFSKNYWPPSHMETISLILDFINSGTKVYYLTGNHDDLLRRFSDFKINNFQLRDKLVLGLNGKRAWFFHGDIFDLSINYSKWLAKLGGKSYDYLIRWNAAINFVLEKMGREKVSLAKKIKYSVKKAVKAISDYEQMAAEHAIDQDYDYVVCGHIHHPQMREYKTNRGSVTYLNSGDWVENMTSLEYNDGQWKLFRYTQDFMVEEMNEEQQLSPLDSNGIYQHPAVEEAKAYKLIS